MVYWSMQKNNNNNIVRNPLKVEGKGGVKLKDY